ncbi:hybrid sensor histidine kinase/response regulator [Methyloversatilis sp.]|uniref:sensor histidine kinase n=1 Tax=Methyloversatilis sp. TaxID=2569862 RepID=UPI003F70F7B7
MHADRLRLRQVLVNLLGNGIKYNRRDGRLDLRFSVDASDAQRVRIDIGDQGPGLAAEQIEHLFEPFARLGAEHSPVEGLGLGLAISRQFVEAMGGRISVASTPGMGATFSVRLPRAAVPVPAHAEPPDTVPPPAATLQTLTLLYVEDEPVNALLVQDALQVRPGWTVLHAADAAAGLALVQACRPALVLSDIQLPGMSGLDLVRALRADIALGGLLCIALSAGAMPDQVAQARAAGFDDYWTKPLNVCTLAERIESALAEAEGRRAATTGVLS